MCVCVCVCVCVCEAINCSFCVSNFSVAGTTRPRRRCSDVSASLCLVVIVSPCLLARDLRSLFRLSLFVVSLFVSVSVFSHRRRYVCVSLCAGRRVREATFAATKSEHEIFVH